MNLHLTIRIKSLLVVLAFTCASGNAVSQNTASPFDIIPRIEVGQEDSTVTITTSSNPFDLVQTGIADRPTSASSGGFVVERKNRPLSSQEKNAIYQRFLFIVMLVVIVILTLVVTVFRIFIAKIWKAFLNDNLLNQLMREQGTGVTAAYLILYSMFILNTGVFLFLFCKHFGLELGSSNFISLMLCIGGVMAFFVLKHILLEVVAFVFPVEKEVSAYAFTVMVFNITIGFMLVPVVSLIAYAPEDVAKMTIYIALGLIVAALIFRGLRGLFIATRFFAWHKFHFFLYLCAVEIAPLLVTIKLLNLY